MSEAIKTLIKPLALVVVGFLLGLGSDYLGFDLTQELCDSEFIAVDKE